MPLMMLACMMCPKGIEATFYALVLAVINAGYLISYWLGGALAYGLGITGEVGSFNSLPVLIGIASFVPLLSLLLLFILPKENQIGIQSMQQRCASTISDFTMPNSAPTTLRDSFSSGEAAEYEMLEEEERGNEVNKK